MSTSNIDKIYRQFIDEITSQDNATAIMQVILENPALQGGFILANILPIIEPITTNHVERALDAIGPIVHKVVHRMAIGNADLNSDIFQQYLKNGFSREEAMRLTLNQKNVVKESIDRLSETMKQRNTSLRQEINNAINDAVFSQTKVKRQA